MESSEKKIAILGDRWWPPTVKQDADRISKHFLCNIWKKRDERANVGGVSIRSRNGTPSRKGCVVNGQRTKASNKLVRPPAPAPLISPNRFVRVVRSSNYKNSEQCFCVVFAFHRVQCSFCVLRQQSPDLALSLLPPPPPPSPPPLLPLPSPPQRCLVTR